MSEPVRQALRVTAEWWDRVDRVEPTDEVYNYNHRREVLVAQANTEVLVYTKTLTDDQIARLRPMLSKLVLALSNEQIRRAGMTRCERRLCTGEDAQHDPGCTGEWHEHRFPPISRQSDREDA